MTKELLAELFSTDSALLEKFHILAPNSAEVCAERTLKDLQESNVEIHLIKKKEKVIGYYGLELTPYMDSLTGFFLTPENRTKEDIENFWTEVHSKFNRDFFVGLYDKNTRAIKFIEKESSFKTLINNIVLFKVKKR